MRGFLSVLTAFWLVLASAATGAGVGDGPVYVLVHGAWGTGGYWAPVAQRLRARGLEVRTPDLPLGDASITAEEQAGAVLAAMDGADRVVLIGYSAGTRPAAAAWDRARDKVVAAIWVEGIPPVPGARYIAIPADERTLNWLKQNAPQVIQSGLMPVPGDLWEPYRKVAKPQPLAALLDAVRLRNGPLPAVPQLYVTAADGVTDWKRIADILRSAPGWTVETIPGGHDVARGAPDALAGVIADWRF